MMMMEHQFPSFDSPIMMLFITFIFFMLIWKALLKRNNSIPNLPPGPWKLPIIGSMHHLIGYLPHHRMRDLAKKYGPIMHLQLGEITNIIITSPEIAKQVFKTHDLIFVQRPQLLAAESVTYNFIDIGFAPYGDYWRQLRKICTLELLTAKRVQSFSSIREEETLKLITSISSMAVINFSRMINSLTYRIISRAAFGKIWEGEEIFIPAVEKIIQEIGRGVSLADVFPSFKFPRVISAIKIRVEKLQRQVDKIFESILLEHRARRGLPKTDPESNDEEATEDFVHVLLNLQDKGDLEFTLTEDTIKALIMDMFVTGSDTSSTTIEWIMSELIKNPRVMEKAQAEVRQIFNRKGKIDEGDINELNYLKLVIKENLRLHPPAPLLVPRECRENCVINGYDIPKKSKIFVNAWAIQRDPNYWHDAEKFYPERFIDNLTDYKGTKFEFIPFGSGRRMCPGMLFGLASIELPLALLLCHFDWKLPRGLNPENLDMIEEVGGTTKRKNALHLIPIPYVPPTPLE